MLRKWDSIIPSKSCTVHVYFCFNSHRVRQATRENEATQDCQDSTERQDLKWGTLLSCPDFSRTFSISTEELWRLQNYGSTWQWIVHLGECPVGFSVQAKRSHLGSTLTEPAFSPTCASWFQPLPFFFIYTDRSARILWLVTHFNSNFPVSCFQSPKRSVKLHDGSFGYAEVITIKVPKQSLIDARLRGQRTFWHKKVLIQNSTHLCCRLLSWANNFLWPFQGSLYEVITLKVGVKISCMLPAPHVLTSCFAVEHCWRKSQTKKSVSRQTSGQICS